MKWQVSPLHRQRARWNLRLPVCQKIQGNLKLKEGIGHISTYPLKSCFTRTKSVRLRERLTIEDLRMKWRTSMWTRLFGEDFWIPLVKQQFILVRTVIRIYDLLRIISGVLSRSLSKKLKNWSRIRQKSMVLPRLIRKSTHGARQAYCVTELVRSRRPRPTSSPTRCSVLGGTKENPDEAWKSKLSGISRVIIWKIWIVLMENRWSLKGKYSKDSQHLASSNIFKNSGKNESGSRAVGRQDHLHDNVQRHEMVRKRKCREM